MPTTMTLDEARRQAGERRLEATAAGTIAAVVRGEGPDVVLIHGITDNADTWRAVQQRLAGRARVHAVDLPGHGLSDIPARPLTVAEMAEAVLAYLDAAGVGACVVAGNSLGGGVTLGLCFQAPGRVRAAVPLCALGTRFPIPPSLALMRLPLIAEGAPYLGRSLALGRLGLRDVYARGFRPPDEAVRDYWRQWRVRGRPRYIRALLRALDVAEPTAWLPAIRTPVHVVHGERDRIIPCRVGREIAAALPAATLSILPGVGHMPQHEAVDQVVASLDAALATAARAA